MLQNKLVIRDIFIECPDKVVSVLPRPLNCKVEFVSFRFRVPDEIHPVACPAFSVCSRSEQIVHNPCIGIGRVIPLKCPNRVGGRGKSGQHVRSASNQTGSGCRICGRDPFFYNPFLQQIINGTLTFQPLWWNQCPVGLVLCSLINPFGDERNLVFGEHLVDLGRWHPLLGIICLNTMNE